MLRRCSGELPASSVIYSPHPLRRSRHKPASARSISLGDSMIRTVDSQTSSLARFISASNIKASRLAVVMATLSLLACSIAYAQTPVIGGAIVYPTVKELLILGTNLVPTSGSPVVYLDGNLLTLV